ncbi:dof zinc finger protein DOF3.6-like [Punica granatum]|uniref:Dof zinc finger protein n=2 Tax=Punica granatum TaxID=22663 RepID=A0A218XRR4_PUNGR|nr:dof zinc finger protein DOF3.6-like [Punica granatum]OWM87510.1 hypothetical protein CDL15_Pgr022621 [Punica granatum]PKI74710.1 hypothetical protein CRG98_005037 [Punica granatum]
MVFSSIPVYLDPPNWSHQQQQPNQEPGGGGGVGGLLTSNEAPQLPQPPPPAPPGGPGSVRPGSMADRARMAKIPMPEPGLKCPRCESTNTKFCYFNNYSLSQPRHFCKTCRRYWTRGGALRSVPVGGGCRRNKRSKGNNRSKSPAVTAAASSSTTSGGCGGISSTSTGATASADVIIGHSLPTSGPSQLFPFLPPLHNLNDYVPNNIGLNFETSRKIGGHDMEFPICNTTAGNGMILPNGIADQQWRLQQFSFFGNNNLQASAQVGFYPIQGDLQGASSEHPILSKPPDSDQITGVKMEEISQGLNLSRNFSDLSGTGQYWQGNGTGTGNAAWGSDLSHGF